MGECSKYGFFNGIYGLEQKNWADYWRGIIPDGVIAGVGAEMRVSAVQNAPRTVKIGSGEAMVDNHKAWLTSSKQLALESISGSTARIDLIVLRCTYGNSGESKIEYTYHKGNSSTTAPTPTTEGTTYEIPLAEVKITSNAADLTDTNIKDRRYVYSLSMSQINTFTVSSGTTASVTPLNDREYRYSGDNGLTNLTITLPLNPHDTFITGVCYTTAASGSITVNIKKGGSAYTTYKLVGDKLTSNGKRYELIIWWDSLDKVGTSNSDTATGHYWIAAKAV